MKCISLTSLFISVLSFSCLAQNTPNFFDYTQKNDVKVISGTDTLEHAWAGGLSSVLVNSIDLDFDGLEDLIVFDKKSRILQTYLQRKDNGVSYYHFAPEYAEKFPSFNSWVLTRDFDNDGKKDLFFNLGNDIAVWRNTGTAEAKFENALYPDSVLRAQLNPSSRGLLWSSFQALPGIADVDNDGDLDILNFGISSIAMDWYENLDSGGLNYKRSVNCWGGFAESGLTRSAVLDHCVPFYFKKQHSGSSTLIIDLNNDNLPDLVLGNASYSDLIALYNDGSIDTAHMGSQDSAFPNYTTPVQIETFPTTTYEDVNFDGVPDLIVSPAGSLAGDSENKTSVMVYKNNGATNNPNFAYQQNNFLQEDMINMGDGAVPRIVDLNGDSLMDLVVANYSDFITASSGSHYYHYYLNIGNDTVPKFTLVDSDLASISTLNVGVGTIPCFGDLDNDGDQDMIVGSANGNLYFYENSSSSTPTFSLQSGLPMNIDLIDVGNRAAPFLFDMDKDGDLDLLIGNERGVIYYYSNSSKTSPSFTLETNFFGGISVYSNSSSYGKAIPYVFEANNEINVMVGSEKAGIVQFDSVSSVISSSGGLVIDAQLGNDTLKSINSAQSLFGLKKRTGRNQILIRSDELKAMGYVYGYITSISFEVLAHADVMYNGFNIKIKNASDTVLDGFKTGLVVAFEGASSVVALGLGWNQFNLSKPFLWDGKSSLVMEICYSGQNPFNHDIQISMTDYGYNCYATGDITGFNTNRANGCSQFYLQSYTKRPNIKLKMVSGLPRTKSYLKGVNTAPAYADLDNDGYMDLILGMQSGGLQYHKGKRYTFGLAEDHPNRLIKGLKVYPNPGKDLFKVENPAMDKGTLHVYNLNGQLVLIHNVTEASVNVDLSDKPNGLYLFHFSNGKEVLSQKVIKQ